MDASHILYLEREEEKLVGNLGYCWKKRIAGWGNIEGAAFEFDDQDG